MSGLAVVAAIGALAGGVTAGVAGAFGTGSCPSVLAEKADLGRLAFVDRDQLKLVELATCRVRTLVGSGVAPPVRWSADGRYLAYGDGNVVAAAGGAPARPLGRLAAVWPEPAWAWSPTGHRFAGVTAEAGVVVGGPGVATRRLLADGWGATSIAWSPDGRTLAISRSLYGKAPPPYHQEIWLLDLSSSTRTLLLGLRKPEVAPPWLAGFSPDGRWLLAWEDSWNSSSLAADGLPLIALRVKGGKPVAIGKGTLVYSDFLSWCTPGQLAYVLDNGGRQVTLGDQINLAGPPPNWPVVTTPAGARRDLSFVSPACSPPNLDLFMVAAAAGQAGQDEPFGHEHRAIWLLSLTGGNWQPLEPSPPGDSSDELPLWSTDAHWIAFIRTTPTGAAGSGRLYLLNLGAHFNGHTQVVGPIANLGSTSNYYGHYGWAAQIAWYS